MLPAIVILWLASSLSALTGREPLDVKPPTAAAATTTFPAQEYRLYTGEYLTSLISGQQGHTPALAPWLPTLIFVLSCGISFATGTSWGTMAIVMPIAIQLAFGVLGSEGELSPQDPLLIATIGSVLAGSIFGDHCSPISDTTILSSQSCACDHTAHVWTQLPYAVAVGVISVLCGTLPVGFGCPVGVALALGCICVTITVYVAGQKVTDGFHSRE